MIRLRRNQVAVEPIFDPLMIGSLYIPEGSTERCDQGIIKYVGPKVKEVSIGDHVLFSGYSGTLVNLEGEGRLIVMYEPFITCIVYPDKTPINGLYFKAADGTYFTATYEEAFFLMAKDFEESGEKLKWGIKLKQRRTSMPDTPYTEEIEDEEGENENSKEASQVDNIVTTQIPRPTNEAEGWKNESR